MATCSLFLDRKSYTVKVAFIEDFCMQPAVRINPKSNALLQAVIAIAWKVDCKKCVVSSNNNLNGVDFVKYGFEKDDFGENSFDSFIAA